MVLRKYIFTFSRFFAIVVLSSIASIKSFSEDLTVWLGESIELLCPVPALENKDHITYSQSFNWQKCPDGISLVQVGGIRQVKITINKFFTDTRTVTCQVTWYEHTKTGSGNFGPYTATYRWNISYYKVGAKPTQDSYNIKVGQQQSIGYEISPRPSNPEAFVTFTSSDPSVASVDNSGNIMGLSPGSCDIILKTNYNVENSCRINVNPIKPEAITLNSNKLELNPNEKFTLAATFQPSNCTNKNLSFSSSDENIAEVSEKGIITANSIGNATIAVSTVNGITDYCNVVVSPIEVSQIKLGSSNINMYVGDSAKVNATLLPENCTNRNILYQVSNPDIAIINDEGIIKAISLGSTIVNLYIDDVVQRAILTVRKKEIDNFKINFSEYSKVKVNNDYQNILNQKFTALINAHSDYRLKSDDYNSESWKTSFYDSFEDISTDIGNQELSFKDISSDKNIYIVHTYLYDVSEYDITTGIDQAIDDNFYYFSSNNALEFRNLPSENTISVYDINGRIIYNNPQSITRKCFSLPSKGVFIIEVKSSNGMKSYKVRF